MSLTHHVVLKDGGVVHEDFSREAWESAMRAGLDHWGHRPDDCHDPLIRHRERLRVAGYYVERPTRSESPKFAPPPTPSGAVAAKPQMGFDFE